jgi:putative glutamine amidotransferase
MDLDSDRFYLRKQYSEAVFHAGGTPVLLPLIDQGAYAEPLSEAVDGILLSGSHSDVDPHLYREEPHPRLGTVNSRRDRLDYLLLEQALNRKKPLLAICYGFQILNVYLGGSLWQDLEAQVKG